MTTHAEQRAAIICPHGNNVAGMRTCPLCIGNPEWDLPANDAELRARPPERPKRRRLLAEGVADQQREGRMAGCLDGLGKQEIDWNYVAYEGTTTGR